MSTIFHRENGFVLVPVDDDHGTGGWVSWIYHECNGMGRYNNPPVCKVRWCDPKLEGRCAWCTKRIPDEIHGLWKLHNFDRYQKV